MGGADAGPLAFLESDLAVCYSPAWERLWIAGRREKHLVILVDVDCHVREREHGFYYRSTVYDAHLGFDICLTRRCGNNSPIRLKPEPMLKSVAPPGPPEQFKSTEELFLAGQRIEQFHNPGLDPLPTGRRRSVAIPAISGSTRRSEFAFKQARFAEAEQYFRKALARLTDRYTTPKDAEATYYLGLSLKAQGKTDEAYEALYKSTWSMAWRAPGYYEAAEIASSHGDFATAGDLVDRALEANALNLRALTLKAAVLRNARRLTDPLDAGLMAEQWLGTRNPADARPSPPS